jgi:hypothetical protein
MGVALRGILLKSVIKPDDFIGCLRRRFRGVIERLIKMSRLPRCGDV